VSGALSQEDFETLKQSITTELASIDAQLKALQEEQMTMQSLMEQATFSISYEKCSGTRSVAQITAFELHYGWRKSLASLQKAVRPDL